jgi:hypothetical protein
MKRGCLITLLVLLLSAGALVVGYNYKYPNYTYRYRLTVNIEVNGKLHSGSSVIEVTWHGGPAIGDAGGYGSTMRGQAALVDLEDRGVVVATLIAEDWGWHLGNAGWGALWIVPRAFGDEKGGDFPSLPKLAGKRELRFDNLPRFLWFSNPQDPTTAQVLLVKDIPSVFGPSARFVGASVEITNDPVGIDIRQKLQWLKPLEEKTPLNNIIYLPNKLGINRYMFIGDAS